MCLSTDIEYEDVTQENTASIEPAHKLSKQTIQDATSSDSRNGGCKQELSGQNVVKWIGGQDATNTEVAADGTKTLGAESRPSSSSCMSVSRRI